MLFSSMRAHLEVQILADHHGNYCIYERDARAATASKGCRGRSRFESFPPVFEATLRRRRCSLHAGELPACRTVEFLYDVDSRKWYFIEVNPPHPGEHTVTEMVTGIDLVSFAILIAQGHRLHEPRLRVANTRKRTAQWRSSAMPGDNRRPGETISPQTTGKYQLTFSRRFWDSAGGGTVRGAMLAAYTTLLLVKVTAWGTNLPEACQRMEPRSSRVPYSRCKEQIFLSSKTS